MGSLIFFKSYVKKLSKKAIFGELSFSCKDVAKVILGRKLRMFGQIFNPRMNELNGGQINPMRI